MSKTEIKLPSIAQMRTRSLTGHRLALEAISEGRPVVGSTARVSEIRGMRAVLATLRRWECVTPDYELTERGTELLEALTTEKTD